MVSFRLGFGAKAILSAVSKSHAIVEFDVSGNILTANENFCRLFCCQLTDIIGQNQRSFVDPAEAASDEYRDLWTRLGQGEFDRRQYKRIAKDGQEIWVEASYNRLMRGGKARKIIQVATDITAAKRKASEDDGKLNALSRVAISPAAHCR